MTDRFIAVDWGTTNRRAYLVADGAVIDTFRDDRGVLAMAGQGYPAAVAQMRERLGDWPVLIAGMPGSNRGWREAPYVPCPATLRALVASILWVEPEVGIIPGVAWSDGRRADVMRGEEMQMLGAVAAGFVTPGAMLCQPGTHCKWASVDGDAIVRFDTAMTGELFALLRGRSILSGDLGGPVADGAAFREGVRDGRDRPLSTALFGARAAGLLGLRDPADTPSYISGLLIGADVSARSVAGVRVCLLGEGALMALYAAAIEELGGRAEIRDGQAALIVGMTEIRRLCA